MNEPKQIFVGWFCSNCNKLLKIISGGCCPVCWNSELEIVSQCVDEIATTDPKPTTGPIRVIWQPENQNRQT